jgi:hypothetical protein
MNYCDIPDPVWGDTGNVLYITSLNGRMIKCAFCGEQWHDNWIDVDGVEVCLDCWDKWAGEDMADG